MQLKTTAADIDSLLRCVYNADGKIHAYHLGASATAAFSVVEKKTKGASCIGPCGKSNG
jgi:hypothetical protein